MPMGYLFTKENARKHWEKSLAARKANYAARKAKPHWSLELQREKGEFALAQIASLRNAIEHINAMILRAQAGERLVELSRALGLLLEEERLLSGRTLPGRASEPKPPPAAPAPVATTLPDGA